MLEKTTFSVEKFNRQRVIQLVIFLIVIIGLGVGGLLAPASDPKISRLLWFFAAFSAVVTLVWFYRPFISKKKTGIACDSEGCEVKRWKPTLGGSAAFRVERFRWCDVAETLVSDSVSYDGKTISRFSLKANGEIYNPLLETTHEDFPSLLNYVNTRTQHLPYEWVPRNEAGNRQIIKYGEYCKVHRR